MNLCTRGIKNFLCYEFMYSRNLRFFVICEKRIKFFSEERSKKKFFSEAKPRKRIFLDLSKEKNLILFSQITKNQILLKFLVKDCLSSFTEIFFSNYFFPKNFISYNDSLLHKEFHIIK